MAPTTPPISPAPSPGAIPTERLAQKRRNERTDDSQNGRQNKASRLVVSRHDEFRNDTSYESNNDRP
jgi:hypothetical protein